jgi:hypothetical protein
MKLLRSNLVDSVPTPAAVAASVRRVASLQAAELRIAKMTRERDELRTEQRRITASRPGDLGSASGREINRLAAAAEKLEAGIQSLRIELAPLQREHAAKIDAALAPVRRDEAQRALTALADLRGSLAVLAECDDVSSVAGDVGSVNVLMSFGLLRSLGGVENVLRTIAEAGA